MRLGLAIEEILNPRMKKKSDIHVIFKHMKNEYIDEVFASMNEMESEEDDV